MSQSPIPTRDQFSAGGVAFRQGDNGLETVIVLMLPERRWQLPKGVIDPGETPEQAALREVQEEGGIECEIVEKLDTIEYWFTVDRDTSPARIHKRVSFYLMRYLSGDVADHDHEVEEAVWVTFTDALARLEFESERDVVAKALDILTGTPAEA